VFQNTVGKGRRVGYLAGTGGGGEVQKGKQTNSSLKTVPQKQPKENPANAKPGISGLEMSEEKHDRGGGSFYRGSEQKSVCGGKTKLGAGP